MDQRYSRQLSLDKVGKEGQARLQNSHVVIVGAGGLGALAAVYLAGAGVGEITIIDGDTPSESNLHRQVFYQPHSKLPKVEAMKNYIESFNPSTTIHAIPSYLTEENIKTLKNGVIVLECTDDLLAKFLVNDYCYQENIPMVFGAIYKYDGYLSLFLNQSDESIQLRDIWSDADSAIPSCEDVGVLGTTAGTISLLQANEAIKFIAGFGTLLAGKLLIYNFLDNQQLIVKLKKHYDNSHLIRKDELKKERSLEVIPSEIMDKMEDYNWISILEPHEHVSINDSVQHYPLSSTSLEKIKIDSHRPTLVYCLSGRRSLAFVNQLKKANPQLNIYSLKGGVKRFMDVR